MAVGIGIDYAVQVISNRRAGNTWKESLLTKIDFIDLGVSGTVGFLTGGFGSALGAGSMKGLKYALRFGAPAISAGFDFTIDEGFDHNFDKDEIGDFALNYTSSLIINEGVFRATSSLSEKVSTGIKFSDAQKIVRESIVEGVGAILMNEALNFKRPNELEYQPALKLPTENNPYNEEIKKQKLKNQNREIDNSIFNLTAFRERHGLTKETNYIF